MYFIDVQGTLIDDAERRPIPGALEAIERLNAEAIPYVIVTNNSKLPSEAFLSYLVSLGFAIPQAKYLDALAMLKLSVPEASGVAVFGSPGFRDLIGSIGYRLEDEHPDALLLSVSADYDAEQHARMVELLMQGAKLIGMHETTLYATGGKRYPGTGALLRMLSYAASVPYSVIGKPGRPFYEAALGRLQQQAPETVFSDVTMISDDLSGDLAGAKALGMRTVLVLSGKVRPEDDLPARLPERERPSMVYNDISFLKG